MTAPRRPGALCPIDALDDPGAKGIDFDDAPDLPGVIVVRHYGALYGYVNRCPHQGTPLETFPDKFLDRAGGHLICSTHGARFRVGDGQCVAGPCKGKFLAPVALSVEDGWVRREG